MNNYSKTLCFDEPHITGGNCHVTLTEAQAIYSQRLYEIAKKFVTINNDETLLNNFIVVHHARYVSEKGVKCR